MLGSVFRGFRADILELGSVLFGNQGQYLCLKVIVDALSA